MGIIGALQKTTALNVPEIQDMAHVKYWLASFPKPSVLPIASIRGSKAMITVELPSDTPELRQKVRIWICEACKPTEVDKYLCIALISKF